MQMTLIDLKYLIKNEKKYFFIVVKYFVLGVDGHFLSITHSKGRSEPPSLLFFKEDTLS